MTVIYYEMNNVDAKLYKLIAGNGHHGMNPRWACKRCAEKEVYQTPNDHCNMTMVNLMLAAIPKYKRAFDRLKKAGILKCVKRGPKPVYVATV